ncbi:uncharacterized protein LOC144474105 isoform X2 [Augochlora pura]
MSDLNDSVIICETLSDSNKQTESHQLNRERGKKKHKKRTFYESPLRQIQLSKRWQQKEKKQKQLNFTVTNRQSNDNQNELFSNDEIDSLCQDGIIVISDNECEWSNISKDKHICKDRGRTKKRFLEKLDNNNSNLPLKRKKSHVVTYPNRRRTIFLSDNEDSDIIALEVDDENRVPSDSVNQSTDDVVVVWSSKNTALSGIPIKDGTNVNKGTMRERLVNFGKDAGDISDGEKKYAGIWNQREKKDEAAIVNEIEGNNESVIKEITDEENKAENIVNQDEKNRLFMIDYNPDPKNLHCLITKKKKKKNMNDNNAREAQMNDNDYLLFNKENFNLPICEEKMWVKVTTLKPRWFTSVLSRLLRKSSQLYKKNMQPGTSTTQDMIPKDNQSLNDEMRGSVKLPRKRLREIVIDGSNVAMSHTNGRNFSEKGLEIVIKYFSYRGHRVKVFVPQHVRSIKCPLLEKWYTEGIVVFTPSRCIGGKWITPYDDRYIIEYATMCNGIVISSDQFRDLYKEKPEWRDTIVNRLLAPTFVDNILMFPEDPLGRTGPTLEQFLSY